MYSYLPFCPFSPVIVSHHHIMYINQPRYERDINDRGLINAEVLNIIKPGGVPLHQAILDFASSKEADFIVVAPRLQVGLFVCLGVCMYRLAAREIGRCMHRGVGMVVR